MIHLSKCYILKTYFIFSVFIVYSTSLLDPTISALLETRRLLTSLSIRNLNLLDGKIVKSYGALATFSYAAIAYIVQSFVQYFLLEISLIVRKLDFESNFYKSIHIVFYE